MRTPLLLLALFAVPISAATVTSLSPPAGPATGGTEVTLKGQFAPNFPNTVYFGSTPAASTQVIDSTTIVAVTPPHLPGRSSVSVLEGDVFSDASHHSFTFTGPAPASFERILIPTLTPPVRGAFGSEFHTELLATTKSGATVSLWGIAPICAITTCRAWSYPDDALHIPPRDFAIDLNDGTTTIGNPGRFLYIEKAQERDLALNLRVFDVTRDARNFGTEIPVVREREMTSGEPIVLQGVPLDPRFRNTLRIYSTEEIRVQVRIGAEIRTVVLAPGRDAFEPAYAQIGDFPSGVGTINVTIEPPDHVGPPGFSPPKPPMWAFISVTNNDTQLITTITPQR